MTQNEAGHEYVDLMLEVKNGQIVSCEFFGEGKQVEPLTEPMLFKILEGDQFSAGMETSRAADKNGAS